MLHIILALWSRDGNGNCEKVTFKARQVRRRAVQRVGLRGVKKVHRKRFSQFRSLSRRRWIISGGGNPGWFRLFFALMAFHMLPARSIWQPGRLGKESWRCKSHPDLTCIIISQKDRRPQNLRSLVDMRGIGGKECLNFLQIRGRVGCLHIRRANRARQRRPHHHLPLISAFPLSCVVVGYSVSPGVNVTHFPNQIYTRRGMRATRPRLGVVSDVTCETRRQRASFPRGQAGIFKTTRRRSLCN